MKKVIFVMDSLYNGGAEKSLVNLLNELPADKYRVDLLLLRHQGMFIAQVPEWVHFLQTPESVDKLFGKLKKAGRFLPAKFVGTVLSRLTEKDSKKADYIRWSKYYRKLIATLETEYDVAVSYTTGNVMYFVDEKIKAKRKLVWVHNDFIAAGYPKDIYKSYFERMDGIVSISEKCVDIMRDLFPDMSSKMYVVENITSSTVVRQRAQEAIPSEIKSGMSTLVSVGRLDTQKGFDWAISAAGLLKKRGVKFQWFILGTGPLEQELRAQIDQLQVSDCIFLLGARENPYVYMNQCDVFVQSSRYEGKSVVLDEVKIIGKPIVVTEYPTVHDQILSAKEGLIVEMNPEGIADGIYKLLASEKERRDMSEYLLAHEYGNQAEVEKYMQLIDGTVSGAENK